MHPKIYLIKSGLSAEEMARVRAALDIAPPVGTFVFSPAAAEQAKQLSEHPVVRTEAPLAIIANNFECPLAVIDEQGDIQILIEGNKDGETETRSEPRESAEISGTASRQG